MGGSEVHLHELLTSTLHECEDEDKTSNYTQMVEY